MQEIKCPNCGEVFQVDESGYAQILKQVHDSEFDKELAQLKEQMALEQKNGLTIARMEQDKEHGEILAKKDSELAEKNQEIERLKAQLTNAETEKKLAVTEAVSEKEKEISEKLNEIQILNGKLELKDSEMALKEQQLKEQHIGELQLRDEEIDRLKDFKMRMSTKMVGESLEQYCMNQFNSLRMTAFPFAYFEKDNDAKTGSKGDFIFRDYVDGTEFISIMFEMKNEIDTTATKHKNVDFFSELNKDRNEKKCEYAVLVSMLESDSDLYNNGIVDVSYQYPKMYVIRPQFFIPLISLLRNAALNSLEYRQELEIVRNQQVDLYNFEENLEEFKKGFADSFRKAGDRFEDAIKGIDSTISALTKIRENLVKSENHLNTANNKLEGVTIKKLTKNAPSVKDMLDEIKSGCI